MGADGVVYLVGAGPGDPGLITVTGLERLRSAEVVVYDRLVDRRLLAAIPADAERIDVGKRPGAHAMAQDEINQLLVERARAGRRVVRLKGGDPYVFGRGGEEAAHLAEHGVAFEVVPGVTAATAALACAGIPLTHRGRASLAVLVTGHEDPTKPESDINWPALADLKGTLVFYMGVRNARAIAERLIAHGRPAATPAAMVRSGTRPDQRVVAGTLADIAGRAEAAGIDPPALLVVGEVVELREALDWFGRRPLVGQTVAVTRPHAQAVALCQRLADLGADVLELPTIRIELADDLAPLDEAVARIGAFDWIVFTSANAVRTVLDRLAARTLDVRALARAQVAAIGPATAGELRRHGILADLMPAAYTSAALVEEFKAHVNLKDADVLLPRADIAPPDLQAGLEELGARVTAVVAYRTLAAEPDADLLERLTTGEVDWVTFTSGSTARNFAALLGPERLAAMAGRVRFASIGPQTTAVAEFLGLPIAVEADEHTADGLAHALVTAAQVD